MAPINLVVNAGQCTDTAPTATRASLPSTYTLSRSPRSWHSRSRLAIMHSPIQPSPIHRLLEREAFVLPAAPRNVVAFAATSQPSTSFDLKSKLI